MKWYDMILNYMMTVIGNNRRWCLARHIGSCAIIASLSHAVVAIPLPPI